MITIDKNSSKEENKEMLDTLARMAYEDILKMNLDLMLLKNKGISIHYYNIDKDRISIDVHSRPYITNYVSGSQISISNKGNAWEITIYIQKNNFGWCYHQLATLVIILGTFKKMNLSQEEINKLMNEAWEKDKKNIEYFDYEKDKKDADNS